MLLEQLLVMTKWQVVPGSDDTIVLVVECRFIVVVRMSEFQNYEIFVGKVQLRVQCNLLNITQYCGDTERLGQR